MATFAPSPPFSTPHQQLKLTNNNALCCPSSPLQKIHGHGFTKAVVAFSLKTSLSGALKRRRVLKASSVEVKATSQTKKASIQFIQGTDEQTVPDVRLTKSKDGLDGVATFTFTEPSVFDSSRELGDITGMYMIDEEGELRSVDVTAKFINGRPSKIEAKYVMRSSYEWDRFMRFMERYGEENGLQFVKK